MIVAEREEKKNSTHNFNM